MVFLQKGFKKPGAFLRDGIGVLLFVFPLLEPWINNLLPLSPTRLSRGVAQYPAIQGAPYQYSSVVLKKT